MNTAKLTAEIIAIGDELICGARLDTNSQWMSRALQEQGVHVGWHTSVGDQLSDIVAALEIAAGRVDLVITSGGLGPTADDLTREALAELAGVPLELDAHSMAHIEAIFAKRKREMPARNRQQAMLPHGAAAIPNPHGTAPGIAMIVAPQNDPSPADGQLDTSGREVRFYSLPGVPAELREMWNTVRNDIAQLLPEQLTTIHYELHCFGAGESDVEAMLPDLIRRGRDPSVGITASEATITLRVTASGTDEAACRERMAETVQIIRESLEDLVFGEDGQQLQDAILARLAQRDETLTTLEVGSGGQLAMWLSQGGELRRTSGDVAKPVFLGGSVATLDSPSDNRDLRQQLVELTINQLRLSHADWALGVGPYPSDVVPAPDQQFSVIVASRTPLVGENTGTLQEFSYCCRDYPFASHPSIARTRAAKIALNAMRKQLMRTDHAGRNSR